MEITLTEANTHGFYFGIEHTKYKLIEKWFKDNSHKYSVEEYAITWETASDGKHKLTAGQHFHALIYSTTVNNIVTTSNNMKKKLKLDLEKELNVKFLGKSQNGNARQYGIASTKQLRNPDNYLKYILKDKHINNILTKGLKDYSTNLSEWKEPEKDDKNEWFFELQKLLEDLNQLTINEHFSDRKQQFNHTLYIPKTSRTDIASLILEIYLEKKLRPPTKSQMDAFVKYHQLHHLKISKTEFINTWYYSDNF